METIKSYTDLEQSKKLAEILPLKSADMYYPNRIDTKYQGALPIGYKRGNPLLSQEIAAWSLAALIELLPADYIGHKHYFLEISKMGDNTKPCEVRYFRFREDWEGANFGRITHISYTSDNPVDACYEMIINLHELRIL